MRRLPLAWFVLLREPQRLLVAVAGIAFANLLMFMQLGFKGALYFSASRLQMQLQGELYVIHPYFETLISPQAFARDLVYRCRGDRDVVSCETLDIAISPWRNPLTGRTRAILVLGYAPECPPLGDPETQKASPRLHSLGTVLFDRRSRPEFGPIAELMAAGQPVTTELNRKHVEVADLFTLGASFVADGNVLTSHATFRRLLPDHNRRDSHLGLLRLRPGSDVAAVQERLQKLYRGEVLVVTRDQLGERERAYWANATGIGFIFNLGVAIGFLVGVVIVYQILHGDIQDHLSQYATLKAMGYSDLYLMGVVAQEGLLLAMLGFGPGWLASLGLYRVAQEATSLPMLMSAQRAGGVFVATVVMCLASALVASRKLRTADPADIF